MTSFSLHQIEKMKQDARDGIFTMNGLSLTRLVHNIIREYGSYQGGTYYVDARTLNNSDKKLILSHVAEYDDYKTSCESQHALEAIYLENLSYVQSLIDENCDEVYSDDMEELGLCRYRHADNGESFWVRR